MLSGYLKLIDNPSYLYYLLKSRVMRERLFKRYSRLGLQAGLHKPYFILSLDCDTAEDIKVAWDLHRRLLDQGVCPVYAVPGELLRQGEKTYRKIAETGAEFINHGYKTHTYFNQTTRAYASCFFYDQLLPEQVEKDILDGDRALKEIMGIEAEGFRAPHFGTIQKKREITNIHMILKKLNYRFSTSTMPYYSFKYGPIFNKWGIEEIPVSGTWSRPLQVLDSWGYFFAPDRLFNAQDYLIEGADLTNYCRVNDLPVIFNYYVDPSHIFDKSEFYKMIRIWADYAQPVSYMQLLGEVYYE